ncbi:MAG: hypothetical protein WCN98_05840 [Verrucomicrobiaceae bacterium]
MTEQPADVLAIAKSTKYKLAQEGRLPGQKATWAESWKASAFRKASIDRWWKENDRLKRGEGGTS